MVKMGNSPFSRVAVFLLASEVWLEALNPSCGATKQQKTGEEQNSEIDQEQKRAEEQNREVRRKQEGSVRAENRRRAIEQKRTRRK